MIERQAKEMRVYLRDRDQKSNMMDVMVGRAIDADGDGC